jgi:MFS family permease
MLALGIALIGLCFLVLIGTCSLWRFPLCTVIFTSGEESAFSRYAAHIASLSPEDMRGRYQGFMNFAWAISGMLASAGGLSLFEHSPDAVWCSAQAASNASASLGVALLECGRRGDRGAAALCAAHRSQPPIGHRHCPLDAVPPAPRARSLRCVAAHGGLGSWESIAPAERQPLGNPRLPHSGGRANAAVVVDAAMPKSLRHRLPSGRKT